MITGLRVVIGMNARAEAARRYRAASGESRRAAVATSRSVLAYGSLSRLLSGVLLAALSTASGYLALDGSITIGQLVTVLGLAQFLQGSLTHVGTFASNWFHKRASAHAAGRPAGRTAPDRTRRDRHRRQPCPRHHAAPSPRCGGTRPSTASPSTCGPANSSASSPATPGTPASSATGSATASRSAAANS